MWVGKAAVAGCGAMYAREGGPESVDQSEMVRLGRTEVGNSRVGWISPHKLPRFT